MTRVETLIGVLSLLIVADFILTSIAVGKMGATELNPLCDLCGGLAAFLTIKAVVSVAGVIGLLCLRRAMPTAAKISAGVLCVLYAAVPCANVVMLGAMGIAGAI